DDRSVRAARAEGCQEGTPANCTEQQGSTAGGTAAPGRSAMALSGTSGPWRGADGRRARPVALARGARPGQQSRAGGGPEGLPGEPGAPARGRPRLRDPPGLARRCSAVRDRHGLPGRAAAGAVVAARLAVVVAGEATPRSGRPRRAATAVRMA